MAGIDLEIYRHRFQSIAEEMGVTLCRSAYSSNIKERRDFSCALFDAQGQAIAQAAHLPVHLGSMPTAVQAALAAVNFEPGDSVIVNDPFAGGTHLPDITMIDPVFIEQKFVFLVANRAHHADIGGMSAGSMPLSTDIFQEGLRIPPVKWQRQGQIQEDLLSLILSNVRTPLERRGDLLAQWAANQTGVQRMKSLCRDGLENVLAYAAGLQDYAARRMRHLIVEIPNGSYCFQDYLEDDGQGQSDLLIQVQIQINDDKAIVDFSGSAPQSRGCVNTIEAVTLSAVLYVFRCLLPADIPTNSGLLRPIQVIAPVGSIVNASFPAAVVGGNVETSQRIVDVLLGALAQALPDRIPAASGGTMNNLLLGGINPQGVPFSYYETLGSGMGGGPELEGLSGLQTHMTNTLNTPIEALELSFPFRVHQYRLRTDSAGKGSQQGGQGLIREIEVLCQTELTLLTERRRHRPYGLAGGEPGQVGINQSLSSEQTQTLSAKYQQSLAAGERVRLQTPGGGGWGRPKKLL